jgi:zinc transporter 1/2/3
MTTTTTTNDSVTDAEDASRVVPRVPRKRCRRHALALTAVFGVSALHLTRAIHGVDAATDAAGYAGTTGTYVMQTYDGNGDNKLNATELDELFEALRERMEGGDEEEGHAGHGHGHDEEHDEDVVVLTPTEVLASAANANSDGGLDATEFANACLGMLRCAADPECEFDTVDGHDEHADEEIGAKKHVGYKAWMGAAILAEGFLGGLAPSFLAKVLTSRIDQSLGLMNAFSGGIFLSAGLTHILPHVLEASASVKWSPSAYPLPYALVTLGYMMIFFVERVLFHTHGHALEHDDEHGHGHNHGHGHGGDETAGADVEDANEKHSHSHGRNPTKDKKKTMSKDDMAPYVLLIAISLHAILAGVSLGVQSSKTNVTTVAVAIMSHKAPAAFSIGFAFYKSGVTAFRNICAIMFAFSMVTPIGIAIGVAIGSSSPIASLILEGLAAGSFIYVGATEIATDEFETSTEKCNDVHGMNAGSQVSHTHRVHEAPKMSVRMQKFLAYTAGVGVILLAGLATHDEHD